MADSASIDLSPDHAKQFIEQLSHESRAILYRVLAHTVTIDMEMLDQLNVEQQSITQISAGEKPKVICPHVGCEETYDATSLLYVAHHNREEYAYQYNWDADREIGTLNFYNNGDDDGWSWNDEAFFCPRCHKAVALPRGWRFRKDD